MQVVFAPRASWEIAVSSGGYGLINVSGAYFYAPSSGMEFHVLSIL